MKHRLFSAPWVDAFSDHSDDADFADGSTLHLTVAVDDPRAEVPERGLLLSGAGAFRFTHDPPAAGGWIRMDPQAMQSLAGRPMHDLVASGEVLRAFAEASDEAVVAIEAFWWDAGAAWSESAWVYPDWPSFTE